MNKLYINRKLLVIVGPTASGKSDLAVKLALEQPHANGETGAEIVSADSRQVYRGLDIGTGKITAKEMKGVKHHLLDVADPRKRFTAERYRLLARTAIDDILKRGKLPIITGGTGFYIDAIFNQSDFPAVRPNLALRKKLAGKTAPRLLAMLKKLDPIRASMIEKSPSERNNARRIGRAIEIASCMKKTGWQANARRRAILISAGEPPEPELHYGPVFIGIKVDIAKLRERIRMRLEKRLKLGMIAEVRRLHQPRTRRNPNGGLSWKRLDELGLEYRYIARYLRGTMTKQEMTGKLAIEIGRYAKRQMTWFRRNKRIRWISPGQK